MALSMDVVDERKLENNRDSLFREIGWDVAHYDWRDYAKVMDGAFDASYVAQMPVWSGKTPMIINFGALWDRHEINLSLMGPLTLGDVFNHVRDFLHTYKVPWSTVAQHEHTFSEEYFASLRDTYCDYNFVPLAFVDERSVLKALVAISDNQFDAMFDYA